MRTYYLRSFGCQMNEHDAERIRALLEETACARWTSPERPTCSSTTPAPSGRRPTTAWPGTWAAAARLKREDPGRLVVVAGCLAQSRQEAFFRRFPFVDVLVGPQSLHELPELLRGGALEPADRPPASSRRTTRWSAELRGAA